MYESSAESGGFNVPIEDEASESSEDEVRAELARRYADIARVCGEIASSLLKQTSDIQPLKFSTANLITIKRGGSTEEYSKPIPQALDSLTAAELDVLGLLTLGFSNGEIALRLQRSEQTIKFHNSIIYKRLGTPNRTMAAIVAHEAGLLNWATSVIGRSSKNGILMKGTKEVLAEMQETSSK